MLFINDTESAMILSSSLIATHIDPCYNHLL
ncbi:unnamed protein product, partial [Adineta ricciae]